MSTLKTPFKYDFVGSFLRPQALKDAKSKYKNNEISQEEYDKIVNDEITKLVAKQKELGYHAITDGEFRRTFWHLDFMWGFGGVEHKDTGNGVPFNAELAVLDDTYLVGKIKAKPHPFVEYFKFLKQFEDENTVAKYTIPAPAQTYLQFIVPANIESTRKYYPTNEELIADIAAAYKDVIKQFYDAGCRNLQLDDCSWGSVIGENANADVFGLSANEFKEQLLTVNNLALEGKADDMVITSHICRGNYHSTFFSSGGYAPVADYVFALENVDALFLEYDDERSGDFAPLAKVSSDKQVVLGLITTKSPKLERKEDVIARITKLQQEFENQIVNGEVETVAETTTIDPAQAAKAAVNNAVKEAGSQPTTTKTALLDKLTGTVEVQAEGTSATPVTEGLPTPATIQQENNEPVTVNNAPKIGDADYEYQGIESIRHAQQLTDTLMAIDAIFKIVSVVIIAILAIIYSLC